MIRRKLRVSTKLTSVTAVILYTVWLYSSKKNAFKNAMTLVANYHSRLTASIDVDMQIIMSEIQHDDMMGATLALLDRYNTIMSSAPNLLNRPTQDILDTLMKRMDADKASYIADVRAKSQKITDATVPTYIKNIMSKLDAEFRRYVDDVDSVDDMRELQEYYTNMTTTLRPRVEKEIVQVVEFNTRERIEKLEEFYTISRLGMLEQYRRTVDTAKKVLHEMDLKNQVQNYVESGIQARIGRVLQEDITYAVFKKYCDGELSANDIVHDRFVVATKLRRETEKEINFRVTNGHIPNILLNNASGIYLKRFQSVSKDKVMSDAQKRNTNALSKKLYERVKRELEESVATTSFSEENLLELASDYFGSILPDVKNYVTALLVEFSGVLRRARLEGTQTCVVQFYNMRRVMDYNFFFAMCEEEGFDITKTRTRFERFYNEELNRARPMMISLARMPFVTFLYDDSYEFLQSLAELLFFMDETLRQTVDELTLQFHRDLADSVGESLDQGIEDVFDDEEKLSREAVMETFGEFEGNMKVFEVRSTVDEFTRVLFGEINHQIQFITDQMDDLVDSFKVETTEPYNEAFFTQTQQSFLNGDEIDYDGMKRYVVEHMNAHGQAVLQSYDRLLEEFVEAKILPVGDLMESLVGKVRQSITDSAIDEDQKEVVRESLAANVRDIDLLIQSTKTSVRVTLNTRLQQAIVQLDQVMDTTTQNFFNTSLQEVVQEFQAWANPTFTGIYETSIGLIADDQQVLAEEAKTIFEDHVKIFVDLENTHRAGISSVITETLRQEAARIVEDYNTISYEARKSIVRSNMKVLSNKAVLELERGRSSALWKAATNYSRASMLFRVRFMKLANDHVLKFNETYSTELSRAYARSSDIRSIVAEVLRVIEGELRDYFTESHRDIATSVLAGPANALPDINNASVCYPPGLLGLAKPREGDLPSTMAPYLIVEDVGGEGQDLHDAEVAMDDASQILGSAQNDYYTRIVLALSHYDSWKDGIIDDAIASVEAEMAQELRNNTCPNRPKCGDGTYDCEEANRTCRQGYILFTNSYDVLCCQFDPPAAGFPYEDVAKLIAIEMAWAFFTDPGGITFLAKMSRSLGVKMGKSVAKAGRSLKLLSKFGSRLSGKVAKANVRVGGKVASKTGFKMGVRLGKAMAAKVGAKLGGKVALAIGKTMLKGLAKVAVSGPVGMAMLAFDLLSLALDLWDPAGYNNVQAAGQIMKIRDNILEQYTQALANDGITNPLVADPTYNMDPESQGEFIENLVIDWFTSHISEFLSSSEERWRTMPDSEAAAEYEQEVMRLENVMEGNVNFIQELIHENTENTFLVRSSTITNTPAHVVGTSKDPDYDQNSKTHLMVCSLNAAGVVAYNSFNVQKANFVNSIKKKPIFRWMKIVNGYRVYEEIPETTLLRMQMSPNGVKRIGWAFTKVDPEAEFWVQYRYAKEEGIQGMPRRENYMDAWNKDAKTRETAYMNTITAVMEENITTYAPQGVAAATVAMVKNKTADSPDWYPDYDELYTEAKAIVDANIAELVEEERLALLASEKAMKLAAENSDKKMASASNISVQQARAKRLQAEKDALKEPIEPDFAVFKDGFGQSSPLLAVKKQCDDMGYGNYFIAHKGLCEFTRSYCKRYGLTYFYNKDVGTHDCMLSNVQKGFETVFGTTVTRGVKGLFGTTGPSGLRYGSENIAKTPVLLGATGCKTRCVGTTNNLSAFDTAVKLDSLGLGAKFSIWN